MNTLKKVVAKLPLSLQYELKRIRYHHQIANGRFQAEEPEYEILDDLVSDGDWVIDVGANIGQYTIRFSELVGPEGRVIAFEPIPETFALLVDNIRRSNGHNVTLFNAALSAKTDVVNFHVPQFDTGLKNYYQAAITGSSQPDLSTLALTLDGFEFGSRIALIKIDVEGHEIPVIEGMSGIIRRDKPTLIIETGSEELIAKMKELGYVPTFLEGSPNILFRYF